MLQLIKVTPAFIYMNFEIIQNSIHLHFTIVLKLLKPFSRLLKNQAKEKLPYFLVWLNVTVPILVKNFINELLNNTFLTHKSYYNLKAIVNIYKTNRLT